MITLSFIAKLLQLPFLPQSLKDIFKLNAKRISKADERKIEIVFSKSMESMKLTLDKENSSLYGTERMLRKILREKEEATEKINEQTSII